MRRSAGFGQASSAHYNVVNGTASKMSSNEWKTTAAKPGWRSCRGHKPAAKRLKGRKTERCYSTAGFLLKPAGCRFRYQPLKGQKIKCREQGIELKAVVECR